MPHITLKSIANNPLIDDIWEKWQAVLEPLRAELSTAMGESWEEWQIPRELPATAPLAAAKPHARWWEARITRQYEIDASIAARADVEYLYDKPYTDPARVRVAGPFTVESLSPQASGQQLIQELRSYSEHGVPVPIGRKPESDKVSRVEGISAMIEAGQLVLPQETPWLAELKAELLGFPNARYDDQVDAVAQLLTWVRGREIWDNTPLCAPIIVWADDGGAIHEQGDDVFLPELGFSDANLDPWAP